MTPFGRRDDDTHWALSVALTTCIFTARPQKPALPDLLL